MSYSDFVRIGNYDITICALSKELVYAYMEHEQRMLSNKWLMAVDDSELQCAVDLRSSLAFDDVYRIVAVYKEKVIGKAAFSILNRYRRTRHRAIFVIDIEEEYTNKGLGKVMIKHIIEEAKRRGIEQLELEVAKSNDRAFFFYDSFGFDTFGTQPKAIKREDGTYEDIYVMVKQL